MKINRLFNYSVLIFFIFFICLTSKAQDAKTLILKVENEPYILRCFSNINNKVRSHSIAIGNPEQLHYLYDANSGSLLKVWKGDFVDVSPMWLGRGGGFFKTPSITKDFTDIPPIAILSNKTQEWPDSITGDSEFKFLGYKVDKKGKPTFRYRIYKSEVEDRIIPLSGNEGLSREINISSGPIASNNMYFLLAEGADIKKSGKNTYIITGKDFVVRLAEDSKLKLIIRESKGKKQLLFQVPQNQKTNFSYNIVF